MTQKTQSPASAATNQNGSSTAPGAAAKSASLVTEAKHALVDVVGLAADQAGESVMGTKERAADGLGSVGKALRSSGEGLGEEGDAIRGYVDQVADRVDGLSDYVRTRDAGQMLSDVERMARREPALFIGGAFVLGLFTARFLKSTSEGSDTSNRRQGSSQRRTRELGTGQRSS